LLYCLFARPLYTGKASLLVSEIGLTLLTSGDSGAGGPSDTFLYTQTTVLDSTPIIRAAVDNGNFSQMATSKSVKNPSTSLALVQNNVDIELGQKDGIINNHVHGL